MLFRSLTFDLVPGSDTGTVGDQSTTASVVTLTGTTEAGAAVTVQGTNLIATADAIGGFSLANLPLNLGANTLTLRSTDAAGNSRETTRTFTRTSPDTTAP